MAELKNEPYINSGKVKKTSPLAWVPTLYFAEGLPNVIVITLAVLMYSQLGLSNDKVAFYTGWLYLPWVIKPFWSPFVDMLKTKRWWVVSMQFLMGAGLASVGYGITSDGFVTKTLIAFWLIAFCSATHDVAADGYYMLSLSPHEQSFFVGIRSTFYKIANVLGQGVLVFLAGRLEKVCGIPVAWSVTLYLSAAIMLAVALYHFVMLPRPASDFTSTTRNLPYIFIRTFVKFFRKKHIVRALLFILLFRLGEAQLCKISPLFMKAPILEGGLGFSVDMVGMVYGTAGVIALLAGGILGGVLVSKDGLRHWFWPMVMSMNLPNLVYVYMAWAHVRSLALVTSLVCLEQFGYGFGFTAFMLYLIYFSRGRHKTSFYSISTGFMALGMMLPGMFSGEIQSHLGYLDFFIWVCICTIPGFIIAKFLPIDPNFGKKD